MKKILLLTALLGFSFYGFSQENNTNQVQDSTKVESKGIAFKGVMYGIRGGYNISNLDFTNIPNTVSLVPEIQFSAEGANQEPLHLDYIQAPILLQFRLSEKIHIAAGPQVGLKVHKYEDGIKNIAYSGVGGIEYKLSHMLFADLRYTYGFSNIFDDKLSTEAKNSNIQIGVGYKF